VVWPRSIRGVSRVSRALNGEAWPRARELRWLPLRLPFRLVGLDLRPIDSPGPQFNQLWPFEQIGDNSPRNVSLHM